MILESPDIVVTGLAAISSAGVGIAPLINAVRSQDCCLQPVPTSIAGIDSLKWGRSKFSANDYMSPLKTRKLDRCSQLAVVAVGESLKAAKISVESMDHSRIGIALGSGFGGIANSEEFLTGYFTSGVDGLVPMLFPNTVANAAASNASIEHGLKGPNVTTAQRFCSAETAFHLACNFINTGRADIMVTGGVDELTPRMLQGFIALRQHRSYARNYAEGCGLLVLERREHAQSRCAPILAEVLAIRCVGKILPGRERDAFQHLVPKETPTRIGLSGTADLYPGVKEFLPEVPLMSLASVTGRSIAMGGLAMAAMVATLDAGETCLHLAVSPEGASYSVEFRGGRPVQL